MSATTKRIQAETVETADGALAEVIATHAIVTGCGGYHFSKDDLGSDYNKVVESTLYTRRAVARERARAYCEAIGMIDPTEEDLFDALESLTFDATFVKEIDTTNQTGRY